jgi:hypothetical protein
MGCGLISGRCHAVFHQALNRRREQRWLAHVPRPIEREISRVWLRRSPSNRWQRFSLRLKPFQGLQENRRATAPSAGLRGEIDLHHATEDVAPLQPIQNGRGGGITGETVEEGPLLAAIDTRSSNPPARRELPDGSSTDAMACRSCA